MSAEGRCGRRLPYGATSPRASLFTFAIHFPAVVRRCVAERLFVGRSGRALRAPIPEWRSTCNECEAEEVSCDTGWICAGYAALELLVNLKRRRSPNEDSNRPSRKCCFRAARRHGQGPKATSCRGPQRGSRVGVAMRGRSEAQRLDGAEQGSTLKRVMAEWEIHGTCHHE